MSAYKSTSGIRPQDPSSTGALDDWAMRHGIDLYRIRVLSEWYRRKRAGISTLVLRENEQGILTTPCVSGFPVTHGTEWRRITLEEVEADNGKLSPAGEFGDRELGAGAEGANGPLEEGSVRRGVNREGGSRMRAYLRDSA